MREHAFSSSLSGVALATVVMLATFAAVPAAAQKNGPGVSDTEIKLGNIVPYTGPAAAFGFIGKSMGLYFDKINDEGGINGRKIKFISYDDAYNPQKTVELAHRLVEEDQVLAIVSSLGTAPNLAIQSYMNAKRVPQIFVASGAGTWDDPGKFPWTMGFIPSYRTEGRIYGQYIVESEPQAKVAIIYQNDAYGKESAQGMKDGLGGKVPIVAEQSYEVTDATINAQLAKLKASGATVLFDVTTPKFSVQVIKQLHEIGWHPLHIINSISNSVGSVLKPAGFDKAQGMLSGIYLKDREDAAAKDDEGGKAWLAFMDKYYPDGDKSNNFNVYGYLYAQAMVQVLRQCGNDLSRENVMRQAASLKDLKLDMLLPGIAINTSQSDFAPIEQMQIARFEGERWVRFGQVRSGVDPGSVSEGFKAIFSYGRATRETAGRVNANTISIMTGPLGGTYEQIGADLATVLDDGDNLRLLPVLGRGSVQSIADILYLKGVDIGIVRTDTLDYLERKGYAANIKGRFAYITKLFDEEMHIIAPKAIHTINDLDGKTVAIDLPDGGTFVTSITVFERLGIRPHFLYIEQRVALEKLRQGEIDAVIAVEAKPLAVIAHINGDNLHFVPVTLSQKLSGDYQRGTLTSDDYPNLIDEDDHVETISVPALLAAYNWPEQSDRYRRLEHFVDTFFTRLEQLQRPPFHPKWQSVAVESDLPGWVRFKPAQDWLQRNGLVAGTSIADLHWQFEHFLAQLPNNERPQPKERGSLFREFLQRTKARQQ